jgi:hypothetical protein
MDIWELKLIKFDTDLDQKIKPYEKYIAISHNVEDQKGNPGIRGNFFLSNLRIIWYAASDKEVNLSIGLDTINNVFLKSTLIPGQSNLKHYLTIKSLSPGQTKYEFKFTGISDREEKIFKKVYDVFR